MISACLLHLMQTCVLQWLKRDFDSDLLLSETATVKNNLKQLHKGRFNWLISEGHTVCLDSNIGATRRIAKLVRPLQARYGELSSQGWLQIISTVKSSATSGSFHNPISASTGAMSHHRAHHRQENTFILYQLESWPPGELKCTHPVPQKEASETMRRRGLRGWAQEGWMETQRGEGGCWNRAVWVVLNQRD